jgi:hypothetical protein
MKLGINQTVPTRIVIENAVVELSARCLQTSEVRCSDSLAGTFEHRMSQPILNQLTSNRNDEIEGHFLIARSEEYICKATGSSCAS